LQQYWSKEQVARYYSGDNDVEIEVPKIWAGRLAPVLIQHGKKNVASDLDDAIKKYGSAVHTIDITDWDIKLLKAAIQVFESGVGDSDAREAKQVLAILKGYGRILTNPTGSKVTKLELLPEAMCRYLASGAIDGWLYRATKEDVHVAYVVESIYYHPSDSRDNPPYVHVKLKANKVTFDEDRDRTNTNVHTEGIYFHRDDLTKNSVEKMLFDKGYLKETEELKAAYTKEIELFEKYQPQLNKQFLCSVRARECEGNWWREDSMYRLPHATKMVNDEGILEREVHLECYNSFWHKYDGAESKFNRIPIHPYVLFYDLTRHQNCWMHVNNIKSYVYDPTLRDKLILPDQHRDLIDVLTTDMDVFIDDIIAGKSGGTAILCYGAPGLGKTLTAEVYSELVEKPLYRIHAGQLGIEGSTVEKELQDCLRRAERWGAVMLIDEADVYIRARDNDVGHNAVVAAFLKTLEYFNGLLFMTTNRASDVDDAIASRCVAMFRYELPDQLQAKAIWRVLSTQFGLTLKEEFIHKLWEEFPQSSGRDIKQLLKLVIKYCKQKKLKINMEAFRVCAMFRGLK
jgi:hypothetical protein